MFSLPKISSNGGPAVVIFYNEVGFSMPSFELWLLNLWVNMSEGLLLFVFGFKWSVGWHRLLVPANLELNDRFNSVMTFFLKTMASVLSSSLSMFSISSIWLSLISVNEKKKEFQLRLLWQLSCTQFPFLNEVWKKY